MGDMSRAIFSFPPEVHELCWGVAPQLREIQGGAILVERGRGFGVLSNENEIQQRVMPFLAPAN